MSEPPPTSHPTQTTQSPITLLDHTGHRLSAQPGQQPQNASYATYIPEQSAQNSGTWSELYQARLHRSPRDQWHDARQREVDARKHEPRGAVAGFGSAYGTHQQPYRPFGRLAHQPYRPSPLVQSSTDAWAAPKQAPPLGSKAWADQYLGTFVPSTNPGTSADPTGWMREPQRGQQVLSNVEGEHWPSPSDATSSSTSSSLTAFHMPSTLPGVSFPSSHRPTIASESGPVTAIGQTGNSGNNPPNTQGTSSPCPVQSQVSQTELPPFSTLSLGSSAPQHTTQEPQKLQETSAPTLTTPAPTKVAQPKRRRGRPRKYPRVEVTDDLISAKADGKMKGKEKEDQSPSTSDQLPTETPSGITINPNHSTPINPAPKKPRGPRGPYRKKGPTNLGSLVAPAPQPKKKKGIAATPILPTPAATPSPTKDTNDSTDHVIARLYSPPHPEPELQAYRRQLKSQRAKDGITSSDNPEDTTKAMFPQDRKAGYIPDKEGSGHKRKASINPMPAEEEMKMGVPKSKMPKKLDVMLEQKKWLQEIALNGSLEMKEKCLELINDMDKGWVPETNVFGSRKLEAIDFNWSCWDKILERVPVVADKLAMQQKWRVNRRNKEMGWIVKYGVNGSNAEDTGGWVEDWEGGEEANRDPLVGHSSALLPLGYRAEKGRQRDRSEEGWMEVPAWQKMCMKKGFRFKDKNGDWVKEEDLDAQIAALDAGIAAVKVLEDEAMAREAAAADEDGSTDGLASYDEQMEEA